MEGLRALLRRKRNPKHNARHHSGHDVNPEVLHDVARNLAYLVEDAAVRRAHECQSSRPSVGAVDVDAASFAVVADDEAGEEEAAEDGEEVHEPDAVEKRAEHFVVVDVCS